MEPIIKNEIRLDLMFKLIMSNWKRIVVVMLITSVVAYLMLLCIPRYYVARVMLAPEYGTNSMGNGALSSTAAMFGINMNIGGDDAIAPEFYPDIIKSTDFLVPILETKVEVCDGSFKGNYGDYLLKREKYPWWIVLFAKVKRIFVSNNGTYNSSPDYRINPFMLTREEFNLVEHVSSTISCSVEEKTGVINLGVKLQDPFVAANMANTVQKHLQDFIVKYRTEKNKQELMHTKAMCDTAYVVYSKAQRAYAAYVDKHQGLSRQLYKVEEERLDGEMQLAFANYNTLCQQRLLNESEVLRRTPVFTVLQNSTVPVKPAGPKRVLTTIMITFVVMLIYIAKIMFCSGEILNHKSSVVSEDE